MLTNSAPPLPTLRYPRLALRVWSWWTPAPCADGAMGRALFLGLWWPCWGLCKITKHLAGTEYPLVLSPLAPGWRIDLTGATPQGQASTRSKGLHGLP